MKKIVSGIGFVVAMLALALVGLFNRQRAINVIHRISKDLKDKGF